MSPDATSTVERAGPEDAIYRETRTPEGLRILPSELSGGPWNPEHQHGGPVAGLLTRSIEALETPVPMRLARLSIDLWRAVPLRPLVTRARVVRSGKRLQAVEAFVMEGETVLARATSLAIRTDETLAPLASKPERDPALGAPPADSDTPISGIGWDWVPGFLRAVDFFGRSDDREDRDGEAAADAPAIAWARLRCPLVAGEPTSPIVALATLADFASGVGNRLDFERYTSINPDLTISILREPRGSWIGLRGTSARSADGIGQSHAVLHDESGPVAHVQATLLLDRR